MKTIEQRIIEKYKELVELIRDSHLYPLMQYWGKREILDDDIVQLEAQLKEQEEQTNNFNAPDFPDI